jgi:phage terminase large subunit
LDADDWIERLRAKGYPIGHIWLPKDAKAKTFQSRHSAMERFLKAFGSNVVRVVPSESVTNRINAARRVIEKCEFSHSACSEGLEGLRAWCYEWDEDLKVYGKDPKHDWASHHGDAFSYGAQIMEQAEMKKPKEEDKPSGYTLNDLWVDHERHLSRVQRI